MCSSDLALQFSVHIHNRQFSPTTQSSPFVLMWNDKPDVTHDQAFGVEGWIHLRHDQRSDPKFGARGEHCIFVGYPTNQCGFLVWCPQRGPNTVVSTTNVVFGSVFPRAKSPHPDLLPDAAKEVLLSEPPTAFSLEEVHEIGRAHV